MNKRLEEIVRKKLHREELTTEESILFEKWVADHKDFYREMTQMKRMIIASAAYERDVPPFVVNRNQKKWRRHILTWSSIAATIAILIGGVWYLRHDQKVEVKEDLGIKKEVVLELSSGRKIGVANENLHLLQKEHKEIQNVDNSCLSYKNYQESRDTIEYNTLSVPRGNYHQVELSDGTKVWLNADSRLRYPVVFGKSERRVYLEGEGYFEVKSSPNHPFIVDTRDFEVMATGTCFGVTDFHDRKNSTLVEGVITVSDSSHCVQLIPNQQYDVINNTKINVNARNLFLWRYGYLKFVNSKLSDLTQDLSRWYDVNITIMDNEVKHLHFSFTSEKEASLVEVLELLKQTEKIDYYINKRDVFITKHHN